MYSPCLKYDLQRFSISHFGYNRILPRLMIYDLSPRSLPCKALYAQHMKEETEDAIELFSEDDQVFLNFPLR